MAIFISLFIAQDWNKGGNAVEAESLMEKSIYDFVLKDIDGNDFKMEQYRGKVLMVVNTAHGKVYFFRGAIDDLYERYKNDFRGEK